MAIDGGETTKLAFATPNLMQVKAITLPWGIITAKMLSSMDRLSSGRRMVTFASGWLKGEYALLGVRRERRHVRCYNHRYASSRPMSVPV